MMTKPKPNTDVEATTTPPPEWLTETPAAFHSYELTAYANDDHSVQSIRLTDDEYSALKHKLAVLRGLIKPQLEAASLRT